MQLSLARIGVDLLIFQKLATSETPLSLDSLAAGSGVAPQLLGTGLFLIVMAAHVWYLADARVQATFSALLQLSV